MGKISERVSDSVTIGGLFMLLDWHIGGHSYDPLVLGVMVTVGLAGMYLRSQVVLRSRRHRGALVVGYGEGACPEHNRPADGH